ncbi:MAG: hypothetical protein WDM89_20460 [Rhizomicrobium sp.]
MFFISPNWKNDPANPAPSPVLKRYSRGETDAASIKLINTYHRPSYSAMRAKLDEILSCKRILSTSFHGMMLADTYGFRALSFRRTKAAERSLILSIMVTCSTIDSPTFMAAVPASTCRPIVNAKAKAPIGWTYSALSTVRGHPWKTNSSIFLKRFLFRLLWTRRGTAGRFAQI